MNSLTKVLVVDDGHRGEGDILSTELAELGLSSVTTSLEAAGEVLELIDTPSAIFLNMPASRHSPAYKDFLDLAARLRAADRTCEVPLILWDPTVALQSGGISAILRNEVGPLVLSGPDL